MDFFHDSRNTSYRYPYGAITQGTQVTLALDAPSSLDGSVTLRTWSDSVGERLYEMTPEPVDDRIVRYVATFAPDEVGIIWYYFVIADQGEIIGRYGAQDGRRGGEGRMREWEPPSFQLSVFPSHVTPPSWFEPIGGYLYDADADHSLSEIVETLCENYPGEAFRSCFPWDSQDWGDVTIMRETVGAHRPMLPFAHDAFSCFTIGDSVFGFGRCHTEGTAACVLVNASLNDEHDVCVPMLGDVVSELIGGYEVAVLDAPDALPLLGSEFDDIPPSERYAYVHLGARASVILYFHPSHQLESQIEFGVGVLAHITSLPSEWRLGASFDGSQLSEAPNPDGEAPFERPGTMGASARAFVDWLADAGARYWQVLPVNPTDEYGSPYAGISAFAGNVRLLDAAADELPDANVGFEAYDEFCEHESDWLDPYAAFIAIRRKMGLGLTWQQWPEVYKRYDPEVIEAEGDLRLYAEECRREQFVFDEQWWSLKAYANERGVKIIGDMPIYVSSDSADVWANPQIFQLDTDGRPSVVAGCPPDSFAVDGQVWGNPVYDWDACRADGYSWWLRRLERAFRLYDFVRLDHFIGFARYFSIPYGEAAASGSYRPGPGLDLFKRAYDKFGPLPVIAEDLGLITPGVRALLAACGFPGMDIMQFVDGGDPLSGYQPRPGKVAYTGTHDNQTLLGYVQSRYPNSNADAVATELMEKLAACSASVRIFPLQDLIGLGDEARMNVPGVAEGNWSWQASAVDIHNTAKLTRSLCSLSSR